MPKRGEVLPFKVQFTYLANAAAGRDEDVSGTRPFRTESEAMREAIEFAKRGALVTVDKKVGPITHHLAKLDPWTDAQRRLAELADEVTEIPSYDGEAAQLRRAFAIEEEMLALIRELGVKRF
jgi:hypothetical protein